MNSEKRSVLVKGRHIAFEDPSGLDQSDLERGLGQIISMIKREIDEAEELSAGVDSGHKKHQERLTELCMAAARYREALGLAEPPDDSEIPKNPGKEPHRDGMARGVQRHCLFEGISPTGQLPDSHQLGASND